MGRMKRIVYFLLGFVLLFIVIAIIFVQQNKPVYNGNIEMNSLSEKVEVYFDTYGIPHIFAENEKDAYMALGYVHAQDRLWQMELIRRIAAGRLAEIFGDSLVKTDKLFRSMDLAGVAEEMIAKTDSSSQSYLLSQAYLDGINNYIDEGTTPVEFRLIGIEKEHYTLKDIYNVFGFMAFSFAQAHKTDPLLTELKEKLGDEYLRDLDLEVSPKSTLIKNSRGMKRMVSNFGAEVNDIMDNLPVAPFIGSNSWVLGPQKTKKGKVIFANDPHIEFSQPSVWYQAHLITPGREIYGFHLALCPFPVLGHNYDFAYGITMFENDDTDFFLESNEQQFQVHQETIRVKGGDDIIFEVKKGPHGPLVNNAFESMHEDGNIAMDWMYVQMPSDLLDITYRISHSNSLAEFKDAVSEIIAPGLNMMYGDASGNIAWFGAGKLYEKNEGVGTKFILDGSSQSDVEKTLLDFEQNPQAINPSWHYVYSANNQPEEVNGKLYPGYYLPEDRARRILEFIENNDEFTKTEVTSMINDVESSVTPELVKIIVNNVSKVNLSEKEKSALKMLSNWTGGYHQEEVAPTIYVKFIYLFLKNTFSDEMGTDTFDQFLRTHLFKRQIARQLKINRSVWWDDINTKDVKELKDEIITRSFHQTVTALEQQFGSDPNDWLWSESLTLTHRHAFDKNSVLRRLFNVGPFSVDGGSEVINNQIFKMNGKGIYEVSAGPSTRRVIDFSDVENSLSILPTGQSGNVFSKHYDDQAEKFIKGEFVKMMMNKKEIKTSKDILILRPTDSLSD